MHDFDIIGSDGELSAEREHEVDTHGDEQFEEGPMVGLADASEEDPFGH